MLIKRNQAAHSTQLVQRKMATLKTIALVVVLIHFVLNVYGLSSDETCRERLDNLEKLLANLKSRLKSLEEIVLNSSRRTEKLEARITDLESSNWFLTVRQYWF